MARRPPHHPPHLGPQGSPIVRLGDSLCKRFPRSWDNDPPWIHEQPIWSGVGRVPVQHPLPACASPRQRIGWPADHPIIHPIWVNRDARRHTQTQIATTKLCSIMCGFCVLCVLLSLQVLCARRAYMSRHFCPASWVKTSAALVRAILSRPGRPSWATPRPSCPGPLGSGEHPSLPPVSFCGKSVWPTIPSAVDPCPTCGL